MKTCSDGFGVLLFLVVVVVAASMTNLFSTCTATAPSSDGISTKFGQRSPVTPLTASRKLKEIRQRKGDVNLEDYRAIDPVPSSKASIKHGPIEHGSPLFPYIIPKPPPPPAARRP